MIKLFIADDHKVFRDGVSSILGNLDDITVVGEAGNAYETTDGVNQHLPDVILMDISMPITNGIELTKILKKSYPDLKVLIFSMHHESSYIMSALEAGASGYLLKDAGSTEMVNAIRTVYNNGTYYSPEVSNVLIEHLSKGTNPHSEKKESPLTKREKEILQLIAEEYSNPEIAEKLFISPRTVDTHRRNLLEKLELKNTAGLVKYAIKNGYIS